MFTNEELNDIINLLPNKYKNMNIKIYILKNKYHSYVYYKYLYDTIKDIFNQKTSGYSLHNYSKIFIFPFNYTYEQHINKLNTIQTIYHEIRHQYQRMNFKIKYKKYNLNYEYKNKFNLNNYYEQWHENDAQQFSKTVMLNNYNKVSNIVNYYNCSFLK